MNEKLNIAPFVKGDKVVCVESDVAGVLKIGKIYTVTYLLNRCVCGFKVNVDNIKDLDTLGVTINAGEIVHCNTCMRVYYSTDLAMFKPSRFRKVQESKFRAVSFEKVMEETEKICVN